MWRNHLTIAVRVLAKNPVYAFINIFGLSIGIAACLLILLFVRHEISFEKWLPDSARIYSVQATMAGVGEANIRSARTPPITAEVIAREFPQLDSVGIRHDRAVIKKGAEPLFVDFTFTGAGFFEVLALPFVRGDPATALAKPGNLVLTETESERFFGREDPIGKTLTLEYRGLPVELKVSGVIRDIPANSHLQLSFLTPEANSLFGIGEGEAKSWSQVDGFVYVKLRRGDDIAAMERAMPAVVERNIPDDAEAHPVELRLAPVRDIHLEHSYDGSMKRGGDAIAITAFSLIALFILTIACVNFANLATTQASLRAREVALRKVMGARRGQLIAQFLGEALLLTFIATLVALALVELVLPAFSVFVGADLPLRYFGEDGIAVPVVLLATVVGLICGLYPAFVLSRFRPGKVLRSYQGGEAPGSAQLRNLLVLTQFAISIGLIICTAVVYAQTEHAQRAHPGYDQNGLLVIEDVHYAAPSTPPAFAREVERLPGVEAVTLSNVAPADDQETSGQFQRPGDPRPIFLNYNSVGWDFQRTLKLPLLAGRFFDQGRPRDDATTGWNPYGEDAEALLGRGANIILSESAVQKLGFASPAAAVGQPILAPLLSRPELVPSTIIGVVDDARYRSVRDEAKPTVYHVNSTAFTYLIARDRSGDLDALREQIGRIWQRHYPDVPYQAEFARDRVGALYRADEVRGQVFAVATLLAILVACLGLFGLAAFTAKRRTKEIGIRKVFGARTGDIVRLLLWQFCQPVLLANLLAWPIAWWLMRDWLNNFSDRITLHPGWFIVAGLLALTIAAATIASHAVRVARANPIHALRYE